MIKILKLTVAFCALFLTACASVEELTAGAEASAAHHTALMNLQDTCCKKIEDVSFEPLRLDARTVLDFSTPSAKVREFPSGKSYVKGFEIPDNLNSNEMVVRSHMIGGGRNQFSTIFVPSVLFLDRNMATLEDPFEVPLCFYRGWTQSDLGYFGKFAVPKETKYVLVFTDQASIEKKLPYRSSATTAGGGVVYTGSVAYDFPRSVAGIVDVWPMDDSKLSKALANSCWR